MPEPQEAEPEPEKTEAITPAVAPEPEIGYTPGAEDVRALIALNPAARWVADYYPVEIVSDDNSALVVRFSASDASVVARLLLRLGNTAELLEGTEVEERLQDLRLRILDRYGAATR